MMCQSGHSHISAAVTRAGLDLFFTHQSPGGEVPDWVKAARRHPTVYRLFNKHRFMDNPLWLVLLMGEYLRRGGDPNYFRAKEEALLRGLAWVKLDPEGTGLVFVAEDDVTANWGFTDTIMKTGRELFCSVLRYAAAKTLTTIYQAAGSDASCEWETAANQITNNLSCLGDDDSGLLFAADGIGKKPDVWGTAYALFTGALQGKWRDRAERSLVDLYPEYCHRGHIRHLLVGDYWERALAGAERVIAQRDRYQNGAFWGTPAGWVAAVLQRRSPALASQTLNDLLNFFATEGIWECVTPPEGPGHRYVKKVEHYVASLALPYQVMSFSDS
jgi:hypothetical protein